MQQNPAFADLGLKSKLTEAVTTLGFTTPTPIQAQSIPALLEGRDIIGQAQTGTGKTAAFALPILNDLDVSIKAPQALIMTPTRELANQVAEAFQAFSVNIKGLRIAAIYGGQDYRVQLKDLKLGSHIVVGTPGRIMDHMRRGTLVLDNLKTLVLDEADEMLNMGFVEDIEWVLEHVPEEHQTALFSATMPKPILKIAEKYLNDPEQIRIASKQETVSTIEQFYTCVAKADKLDALIRFIEIENPQAAMIFTATKMFSTEIADQLQARGYSASALNGDMSQDAREKVIERVKNGSLQIIVATDVAARGIDVDKITHVFNFDIPCDAESYTHRVGRTGRAGRQGKAISIINPREHRLLTNISRQTKSEITLIAPPDVQSLKHKRDQALQEQLIEALEEHKKLKPYRRIINQLLETTPFPPEEIAAALMYLTQKVNPVAKHEIKLVDPESDRPPRRRRPDRRRESNDRNPRDRNSRDRNPRNRSHDKPKKRFKKSA